MESTTTTESVRSGDEIVSRVAFVQDLQKEIGRVVVGQTYLIERLLVGLLANGHVLVEGVPGLAKTTVVKSLAEAIQADFQRIQFTPDLLPSDLLGTEVFNAKTGEFSTKKGPLFTNIVLADEINRAPSKVQSALLEAMQEKQITLGGETFNLPLPYFVLATQNPIEQEGTYPLPEAQVDRFMMKILITYPSREEEKLIMERMSAGEQPKISSVMNLDKIVEGQRLLDEIFIDDKVKNYIIDLVSATRDPKAYGLDNVAQLLQFGASPRASINLHKACRALAALRGRGFVTPQDVKSIFPDVVRHRILLSYEAEAEEVTPDDVLQKILDRIDVP